jgi:hypothetical protein
MDHEMARLTSWRTIRAQIPVNVALEAIYDRLMDAEERLEPRRLHRDVSDTTLGDALETAEAENEEDVYIATLVRYVSSLGGHLEVRAVFDDGCVTLLRARQGMADWGA